MFKGAWFEQISGALQRFAIFGAGILAANPGLAESRWGQIAGGVIGLIGLLYGIKVNLPSSIVTAANGLENVKGVITTDTPEGHALAASIPGPEVVAAGTNLAQKLATGVPS